jgi:hypothetical protein
MKSLLNLMAEYNLNLIIDKDMSDQEKSKHYHDLIEKYGSICETMVREFGFSIPSETITTKTVEADESEQEKKIEYKWDSKMMSNIFTIALKANKHDFVWTEFEKFSKYSNKFPGELE